MNVKEKFPSWRKGYLELSGFFLWFTNSLWKKKDLKLIVLLWVDSSTEHKNWSWGYYFYCRFCKLAIIGENRTDWATQLTGLIWDFWWRWNIRDFPYLMMVGWFNGIGYISPDRHDIVFQPYLNTELLKNIYKFHFIFLEISSSILFSSLILDYCFFRINAQLSF